MKVKSESSMGSLWYLWFMDFRFIGKCLYIFKSLTYFFHSSFTAHISFHKFCAIVQHLIYQNIQLIQVIPAWLLVLQQFLLIDSVYLAFSSVFFPHRKWMQLSSTHVKLFKMFTKHFCSFFNLSFYFFKNFIVPISASFACC